MANSITAEHVKIELCKMAMGGLFCSMPGYLAIKIAPTANDNPANSTSFYTGPTSSTGEIKSDQIRRFQQL
jgi:hypothetical protein